VEATVADVPWKPTLPEPLPADPLPLLDAWIAEATRSVKNATAMTLATVDGAGRPSARMVICRAFDARLGCLTFYTDRDSAKGRHLAHHPWAAVVFHWSDFERQARIEGPSTDGPDADADAYWATRPREARVAAAASRQSQPLATRAEFLERLARIAGEHDETVPRPRRWGGYRVWAERVELWVGQPGRAHDRGLWTRALTPSDGGYTGGPWSRTRLQP
jgi:pyridoxamine 5'-phosphate oxidase